MCENLCMADGVRTELQDFDVDSIGKLTAEDTTPNTERGTSAEIQRQELLATLAEKDSISRQIMQRIQERIGDEDFDPFRSHTRTGVYGQVGLHVLRGGITRDTGREKEYIVFYERRVAEVLLHSTKDEDRDVTYMDVGVVALSQGGDARITHSENGYTGLNIIREDSYDRRGVDNHGVAVRPAQPEDLYAALKGIHDLKERIMDRNRVAQRFEDQRIQRIVAQEKGDNKRLDSLAEVLSE